MKLIILPIILLFIIPLNLYADEIPFPPELLWWLYEIKKVNKNVEIDSFKMSGKETKKINNTDNGHLLIYPVLMRWNYSANYVAYYNYNYISFSKQSNGKYSIGGGDIDSALFIANRNKTVFFEDWFGSSEGLNAYHWLTDTVLVAVGISINIDDDSDSAYVDLIIKSYKINTGSNTVEITRYIYEKAITNEDRLKLKLDWFEQRPDYFDLENFRNYD